MRLKVWLLVAATLMTSIILSQNAFAARISQVKGKQVLIDLEGDSANVGDKFFVMIDEKKKGLVTITKVKGSRAIGTVDKGKAEVDAVVAFAKAGGGSPQASSSSSPKRGARSKKGMTFGVLGGYSMDSQTAKLIDTTRTNTIDVSMDGTGFSLLGFADIPYSGDLGFIGRAGLEMFNVDGTASANYCSGNTNQCKTEITYLTLDALLRYKFGNGGMFTPWVGGGVGIYYPISKTTTALNPDIGMSTVFLADVGVNIAMGPKAYIPIVLQYGLFPPGPDVSTSIISLRAGYGMSF